MSGSIDRKKTPKGSPKEKVLQIYDKLFQGQDIAQGRAEFWDDFFLLKANLKCLSVHFEKLTVDDLARLKPQLNRLFLQCLHTAQHDKHRIRVANAIQTMDALVTGVFRCKQSSDVSATTTVVNASEFLIGADQVRDFMQYYTSLCCDAFREDRPDRLRSMFLISMQNFATASSDFRTNPFALGLLDDRVYDVLRLTLVNAQLRYHHGSSACKLLGLLMHFGTLDQLGTEQLYLLEDELLLNGVSSTVSLALSDFNLRFRHQRDLSTGFLSSVSSFFGSLFVGDISSNVSLRPCDSLLLCILAIIRSNAHFSILLTYSNAHYTSTANGFDSLLTSTTASDSNILQAFSSEAISELARGTKENIIPGTEFSEIGNGMNNDVPGHIQRSSTILSTSQAGIHLPGYVSTVTSMDTTQPCTDPINTEMVSSTQRQIEELDGNLRSTLEPRNLLADLLEYCSIVMQDVKTQESLNSCQLCFIVILCITQNSMACSIIHDPHITFKVRIHKQRSRYRKDGSNMCENFSIRPIAVAILSLIVEFIRGHLMKKLPYRLYSLSLAICHNMLCYQKEHKIRLDLDWKQLWAALLSLLQFILNLDSSVLPLTTSLSLMQQVLQLFNFCILHGDNFLQAAEVYDDLYYELIRMHELVENVYEHGLAHSTGSNTDVKTIACDVVLQIGNMRSIVNHFNAKIAAFSAANSVTSLTEDQVLCVVRENYDSLNLRVHDKLDVARLYEEMDDQLLFETVVDTVVKQTRKHCFDSSIQLQNYLNELSAIS